MSVISVAAEKFAEADKAFSQVSHYVDFRDKIQLIYWTAARHGKTCLMLGAMGCGTYKCPPQVVAQEMKDGLEDEEFEGWFQKVVFVIRGQGPKFMIFRDIFSGARQSH